MTRVVKFTVNTLVRMRDNRSTKLPKNGMISPVLKATLTS